MSQLHRVTRLRLTLAGAVLGALALVTGLISPIRAQATGQAATIQVDLGHPVRHISPQLFGSNVDWNAEFDFLQPGTTTFYPNFLQQVRSVGFGALRFPGGTLGSYYHWQRAVGALAGRGPNTFFGTGAVPSLLGPDEFGTLLTTSGAVGDVIVNPSTGTVPEAADFVAYMTLPAPRHPVTNPSDPRYWAWLRARNGHPAPYDVPWWEVGNEVNVSGSGNPGWMDGSLVSYANPDCASPSKLACLYDFCGTTGFTNQPVGGLADDSPAASLSDGSADQAKYVVYPPVVPQSLSVDVAGQPWTQVASLAGAAPTAHVYTADPATGKITFGDGTHGAIPASGSAITATYDSGPHPGFVEFYRAMKTVNPAVHVCLGASSVTPDIGPYLEDLGSSNPYDCVPTHPYVRNGTSLAAGEISNSLSETDYDTELLALPQVLGGQVQHLRSEIDQYAGGNASRVTIPITEFGQLRSSLPTFDGKFHYSMEEAILVADEIRQWVNLGVPMAEHYLLEGSPFGSDAPPGTSGENRNDNSEIIGPGPDTFVEPAALVEKLYRALGGENQLPVQAAGTPTVSLPDGSTVPALETVGAFHGDRVTLVVVNQSNTDDIPAEVSAAGAPVGSGTVTTLDGDSPLAYNSPAEPNAVTLHTAGLQAANGAVPVTFPAHSISLLQLSAAPAPSAGA